MTKGKWSHLRKENKTVVLPTPATDGSDVEVVLREPDIMTGFLTGGITLSDSMFAMFATATQEGEEISEAQALQHFNKSVEEDPEAGKGLLDFLNLVAKAAFVEPKLVDSEDEADWETTVPVSAFNMIDKMFVMQSFPEMFGQLSSLQNFRPQANGVVQPLPESE